MTGRSMAGEFFPRGMARIGKKRSLFQADRPRYRPAAPGGQLGLVSPGIGGYALSGDGGVVQFCGQSASNGEEAFQTRPEEWAKWALRKVYYRERSFFVRHGCSTDDVSDLGLAEMRVPGYSWPPKLNIPDIFSRLRC